MAQVAFLGEREGTIFCTFLILRFEASLNPAVKTDRCHQLHLSRQSKYKHNLKVNGRTDGKSIAKQLRELISASFHTVSACPASLPRFMITQEACCIMGLPLNGVGCFKFNIRGQHVQAKPFLLHSKQRAQPQRMKQTCSYTITKPNKGRTMIDRKWKYCIQEWKSGKSSLMGKLASSSYWLSSLRHIFTELLPILFTTENESR